MNAAGSSVSRATFLAALLAVGTLAAGLASAAPLKLCPVLTDAAGDATLHFGGVVPDGFGKGIVPSDASLDLVATDFSLSGANLVAAIRTSKLTTSNMNSPLGQYFAVVFQVSGQTLVLDGVLSPLSDFASLARADGSNVGGTETYPATIRADLPRNTVLLSVALADVNRLAPARRGTRLTGISAVSQRVVGVAPGGGSNANVLVGADKAATKRSYVIGTPTRC